jgi:hypothetical protein
MGNVPAQNSENRRSIDLPAIDPKKQTGCNRSRLNAEPKNVPLMSQVRNLGIILLLSMMGVGVITTISMAVFLYQTVLDAEQEKLVQISEASLKPIVNLAVQAVNGANQMKLKNADAQSLYASAGLLYLHIKGISKACQRHRLQPPSRAPCQHVRLSTVTRATLTRPCLSPC